MKFRVRVLYECCAVKMCAWQVVLCLGAQPKLGLSRIVVRAESRGIKACIQWQRCVRERQTDRQTPEQEEEYLETG
jgi:hypothetical protein